jgi:hypothetical protein
MEQSGQTPGTGETQNASRWRSGAQWMIPLLLGACPSTALVLAGLLPQTGPVTWGPEVVALGATSSLVAVLDAAASDWRASARPRPLWLLGRFLAVALALLGAVNAVNASTPNILYGGSSAGAGEVGWFFLLAFTTVTCSAFITSRERRGSAGAGILAATGFWLPLAVVLTVQVAGPNDNAGVFVVLVYYVCGLLLIGMAASALLVGSLAGLLGGRLLRSR